MSFGRRWVVLVALVAFAAVAACEGPPEPVRLTWQEISLPSPAIGERLAIRAATVCSGRWFLTGAIVGADGGTRPAAWASDDGHTFAAVPIAPNTFYGRQNTLYAAACRYRWLAAIGAKSGGAHGFPRTSNWYLDATGVLQQNEVPYTLYGGPDGVNLSRIVGGPSAWLETGNQVGGATVWISSDAETFRKIAGAPGLASDDDVSTWATDAASVPSGWVIVGAVTQAGQRPRSGGLGVLGWPELAASGGARHARLRRDPAGRRRRRRTGRHRVVRRRASARGGAMGRPGGPRVN